MVPSELAPGWRDLMERCWDDDPEKRPTFTEIVKELKMMIAAIRPPKMNAVGRGGNVMVAAGLVRGSSALDPEGSTHASGGNGHGNGNGNGHGGEQC